MGDRMQRLMLFALLSLGPCLGLHCSAPSNSLQRSPRKTASVFLCVDWTSPDWNWGSAQGSAHSEALRIRTQLATPAARAAFQEDAETGKADFDDLKLALALKCQRARNLGYDVRVGFQAGMWEGLMNDMASCFFEGEGGADKLQAALTAKLAEAAAFESKDPMKTLQVFQQMETATPSQAIARAFRQLDFVRKGV